MGDNGFVLEAVREAGMQRLGGKFISTLMRAGTLVGGVLVVVVIVMVVSVGNAHEHKNIGWWRGGSGARGSILLRGTVFVCDGGGVLEDLFQVGWV